MLLVFSFTFKLIYVYFILGPPHTSPSVIVAKIMEKLREHERSMTCPKGSSRAIDPTIKSLQSTDKSPKHRFNKVAENVLTKIRYLVVFYTIIFPIDIC